LFFWDFTKNIESRSLKTDFDVKSMIISQCEINNLVNVNVFEPNERYFVTAGYSHLKFWDCAPLKLFTS
jgi:hypothetical protein